MILVNTRNQTLRFKDKIYPISTSKYGIGFEENSHKTPNGKFKICEKIGENEEIYTIFKARNPIRIWDKKPTTGDLILSRILWLEGMEEQNKNTKNRYIYIHGTSDEQNLGTPTSIGCIRMKNTDIIELFDLVKKNDVVQIL